jgi:hypothetical protein
MKITRETLLKIIKEEYASVNELGPATGHEEGTKALDVIKELGDNLIGLAEEMRNMPSHVRAQEMAGYTESVGKELLEAHAELAGGAMQEAGPPSDQERHHQRWGDQEEPQDEAQYEVMVQMGRFLAKLSNQGHDELANEFDQILTQARDAGMVRSKGQ